jgi:hypothetical protein
MRNKFGQGLLREHDPYPNTEAIERSQTQWIVGVVYFLAWLTGDRNHNLTNHRSLLADHYTYQVYVKTLRFRPVMQNVARRIAGSLAATSTFHLVGSTSPNHWKIYFHTGP